MGGDRELTMLSMLAGFTLMVTFDPFAISFGIVFSAALVFLLRRMAKHDPDMRPVYLKHRRYQDFYPARSTPFRLE